MDIMSSDISTMVFKRLIKKNVGEVSLDGQVLALLLELDGKKRVSVIAKNMGLNLSTIKAYITKLLQLNLIELAEDATPMLDKDFFEYLNAQLSLATGPIARVLIEDAVADLEHTLARFPSHRAAELVDILSKQIQRDKQRVEFKQNMIKKINEKGY